MKKTAEPCRALLFAEFDVFLFAVEHNHKDAEGKNSQSGRHHGAVHLVGKQNAC